MSSGAFIRLAGSQATDTSITIVLDGLSAPSTTFAKIHFFCTNGMDIRTQEDGGGTASTGYRSKTVTFTGLSPGTEYGFRCEVMKYSFSETDKIPDSGTNRYTTTGSASVPIGSVNNIAISFLLKDSFNVSWDAATNATSYGIRYKEEIASSWIERTTTGRVYSITGLKAATYYQVQVRGHRGTTDTGAWSSIVTVRTQNDVPSKLNWSTYYTGNDFTLTAKNWNDLTSKINAWRTYRGLPLRTMATVRTGDVFTADIFNDIVARLIELNPSTTIPATVRSGDVVTAAKINALGVAIDSLT